MLSSKFEEDKVRNTVLKSLKYFGKFVIIYFFVAYALLLIPGNSGKRLIGNDCLPKTLQGKVHNDYKFMFARKLPRAVTSLGMVEPPIALLGSNLPIPTPGSWQISLVQVRRSFPIYLPYAACTTKSGLHFRIGARWDNYDHYYTFPSLALKRVG
jgi:hypothetical protein